jgi:hypothetical protein
MAGSTAILNRALGFLGVFAAALLTACETPTTVEMRRFDFSHDFTPHRAATGEVIPGWRGVGLAQAATEQGALCLPAGAQVMRSLDASDYPLAMHLDVEFEGEGAGFAALTRVADPGVGPMGLPGRALAFCVWMDDKREQHPFNVQLLRIEGDRMLNLGSEQWDLSSGRVTLDVYDDGEWVLFALDGETMVAREPTLPTRCRWDTREPWLRTVLQHAGKILNTPEFVPMTSTGDIMMAALWSPEGEASTVRLTGVTTLCNAPRKNGDERNRWEILAAGRPLRWPWVFFGNLCDAAENRPVMGAHLVQPASGRVLITDEYGLFVDTRAPEGDWRDWGLVLQHPDHPMRRITGATPQDFSDLSRWLEPEGDGTLTLQLERDADDARIPLSVTLIPDDADREPRVHPTPPLRAPMQFHHLPPGRYRVQVQMSGSDEPIAAGDAFDFPGGEASQMVHLSR